MASKRKTTTLKTTAPKHKLPVTMPTVDYAPTAADKERQRKYAAEDGLKALQRADEVRRDKGLMKDVQALAKQQLKAVSK